MSSEGISKTILAGRVLMTLATLMYGVLRTSTPLCDPTCSIGRYQGTKLTGDAADRSVLYIQVIG